MAKKKTSTNQSKSTPPSIHPKKSPPVRRKTTPSPRPKTVGKASIMAKMPPEANLWPGQDLRMCAPKSGVTVRMYRTGLGDCFLLCFPSRTQTADTGSATQDRAFVLIDCGVFKGTSGGPARVKKIANHILRATNSEPDGSGKSRLELLVVTHEHWDHISGFHELQAQSVFEKIEVGAVWLPWTEHDTDPLALQLRGLKVKATKALRLAYAGIRKNPNAVAHDPEPRIKSVLNMFGFGDDSGAIPPLGAGDEFDRTDGAGTALKWVKNHFKDIVQFREPGPSETGAEALAAIPGVRFYVLGPPKDPDLIRRLNPQSNDDEAYSKTVAFAAAAQSAYFAALGCDPDEPVPGTSGLSEVDRANEQRQRSRPFEGSRHLVIEFDHAKELEFFKSHYFHHKDAWRQVDSDWLAAAGQFALNVDGLANNSSLVLAIELSPDGRVLLFPGDAQMGNWLSWFGKVPYPDGTARGKEMVWTVDGGRKVTAEDLLARTVLYKVGHHGSHNATLKHRGLDAMGTRWPKEFVAMLPVDENLARNHTTYGEMPLTAIVEKLLELTGGRLFRTDEGFPPEQSDKHPELVSTIEGVGDRKPLKPSQFPRRSDDPSPDALYFDYTIIDEN